MSTATDLLTRPAERLVLTGFRNLMAACEFGDLACWESVWQAYLDELGPRGARRMVGELQYWGRALRRHAGHPLGYYPQCCRFLCHDECMALSMISAAQADDEPTACLAARHLTGRSEPDTLAELWQATLPFAEALESCGLAMYPVTAAVVDSISRLRKMGRCRAACLFN
jgi:hypothetical protein